MNALLQSSSVQHLIAGLAIIGAIAGLAVTNVITGTEALNAIYWVGGVLLGVTAVSVGSNLTPLAPTVVAKTTVNPGA